MQVGGIVVPGRQVGKGGIAFGKGTREAGNPGRVLEK